ncbi:hypothetical protein [Methylobacterium indicum]|uniref:hypothetical protein n=1 Tax=Methylobacterium indicum TaxID=1775910 RepID=UPI001042481C|nr:hypothetical protein [Methylobacterium indicum]
MARQWYGKKAIIIGLSVLAGDVFVFDSAYSQSNCPPDMPAGCKCVRGKPNCRYVMIDSNTGKISLKPTATLKNISDVSKELMALDQSISKR